MDQLPRKGQFTKQVNIKIDEAVHAEIEMLRAKGVDLGKLLRPAVIKTVKDAVQILESQAS